MIEIIIRVFIAHIFVAYLHCVSVSHICIAYLYCISLLRICVAYLYCISLLHIFVASVLQICIAYLYGILVLHICIANLHCIFDDNPCTKIQKTVKYVKSITFFTTIDENIASLMRILVRKCEKHNKM